MNICIHGLGAQETAVTARFLGSPPEMVVTTMCALRVTMVDITTK
jgi:hypothetical protein